MSFLSAITKSLAYHWRIHAAVALGVAAATAVLTGALLIGDSVRGSLRHLVLDRLGKIDDLLVVDRFFRQQMAVELNGNEKFKARGGSAVPAILFPAATVQSEGADGRRVASGVFVVGGNAEFWGLEDPLQRPKKSPGRGEIIVNQPLADELKLRVGDSLVVRFGKANQVPADSPLGRRSDRIANLAELKLIEIIPAEGLGRFGLTPSQLAARNAYVSLADVQSALEVPDKVNAIFVSEAKSAGGQDAKSLHDLLSPQLIDYGLTLKHVKRTFSEGNKTETIYDYYSLSSERMLIDPAMEAVVRQACGGLGAQGVLTYLANNLEKVERTEDRGQGTGVSSQESDRKGIPYSTITAIDPAPGGPLTDDEGKPLPSLADDEIVLTSWAAEDQQAKVGDRIRVTYFEPETTHGEAREASAEFRVKAIVPLTEPRGGYSRRGPAVYDKRPTPANDPDLTPEVKGITDQATIADWDPPFPFDQRRIRPQDDVYWENHRTTPKAYVSLATGQKLWGSRFGYVTSLRIPAPEWLPASEWLPVENFGKRFREAAKARGDTLGFDFQPIKQQGLKAASGTTPFDVLFLLLSMFIIAAAVMLVWLLFRLGVEQRADEIGLLLALGWSRSKVRRLFTLEGSIIAALGGAIGVLGGIGYAWLMLAALRTWWIGAIATPFLTLYIGPISLIAGFTAGVAVSVITIWFSMGRMKRAAVRGLLAGEIVARQVRSAEFRMRNRATTPRFGAPKLRTVAAGLFLAAVGLAIYASRLAGEAQAGAFMGAGAALLTSLVILANVQLRSAGRHSSLLGGAALGRLSIRNAGRNVGRSTATIALVASAAFLIVAVSAFRMSPTDQGVGGFDLLAESSQPIYEDLNSATGREKLLADNAKVLDGGSVLALRLKEGDDASCRNMYQPTQPRILGVTPEMIHYFDRSDLPARFAWSASAAKTAEDKANPWRLLSAGAARGEPVPVVLDQNTAMYSLRLYGGVGQVFEVTYDDGSKVKFRVAGLLSNSVLQGSLLIGEANFKRLFPQISGYRSFLIRSPPGKTEQVTATLEEKLSDEGFDAVDSRARLADLLAVQNTYISTFQSLGALGLVLGTFGLAAVQLRSVFERRRELAVMRAAGFRSRRLAQMVLLENLVLLVGGLALGTIAAVVAVLPQMLLGAAHVPLADLAAMLGVVLVAGIATGLIAIRATLRAPVVAALRGE